MKSKISTHTREDCFAVLHEYKKPKEGTHLSMIRNASKIRHIP